MRLLLLILMISPSAFAETVKVDVPGMVCQMCVHGMRAKFKEFVENADRDVLVDLDKKVVTLKLKKDHKLNDKHIKQLVEDAGYNAKKIHRHAHKKGPEA